jgi:hypothetical protein
MATVLDEDQVKGKQGQETVQPVTVDVTPMFGDGTICGIDPGDGPSHSFIHGGIIRLKGNPSFQVTFLLPTNPAPAFQFDRTNPIWSSQEGCPNGACQDDQISNPSVDSTGMALTIDVDPNPDANAVHVSLGWSNGNRFDPIIINN